MSDLPLNQYTVDSVSGARRVLYLQHYCQLMAVAITFFDHALTFDKEVELIWRKGWSKSKTLYFLCRYLGNFLIIWETIVYLNRSPSYTWLEFASERNGSCPTDKSCLWGVRVTAYLAVVCTLITQFIMRLRIQALYNNKKLLTRLLFVVLIGEIVSLATIGLVSMQQMEVTAEPLPGIYQCTQTRFPTWSWLFWLPILFFDTLLFGLAIGIVIQSWRELVHDQLTEFGLGPSLMIILLRDNFGYFFFAFGIYLLTTIVWLTADTVYFSIPAGFSFSVTTVLGSRLILNLCDAYYNPLNQRIRTDSEWDMRIQLELGWATGTSIMFAPFGESTASRRGRLEDGAR